MTPEERAKRVMFGNNAPFMDDDILTASHGYIISYPQLVAAIREAVMAEREACAKIADDSASRWDSQPDDDCASIACGDIAAAIRARTP
jgi:hypothetical protein